MKHYKTTKSIQGKKSLILGTGTPTRQDCDYRRDGSYQPTGMWRSLGRKMRAHQDFVEDVPLRFCNIHYVNDNLSSTDKLQDGQQAARHNLETKCQKIFAIKRGCG